MIDPSRREGHMWTLPIGQFMLVYHHMCPMYCIVACVIIELFVLSAGDLSRAFLRRPAPRIKVITVECSISCII